MNRISTLKHLPEVGGFEHQGTHIMHDDTKRRANRWLAKHKATMPNVWTAHPGAARAKRIDEFKQRAARLEARR